MSILEKQSFQERVHAFLCSRLCFSLITTYFFAFIAHGYGILHNSVGHDSITHFYSGSFFEGINLWKIQLGRWFVPIYRGVVSGYLNMPWLISLLAFFWISLSVYFCLRIFKINNRLVCALLSAVMVINTTVSTQIATYIHEFDVNTFALFLATFSAYLIVCSNKKARFIIVAILLILVLGIYQSYISVFLLLMLLHYLLRLVREEAFKPIFFDGLKTLAVTATSGIAYILACKVFCWIYNTELETSSGNSLTKATSILDGGVIDIIKKAVGTYQDYFRVIFNPASMTPLHIIDIITVLLFALGAVAFIFLLIRKKTAFVNKVFACAIFCLIPFAINFPCFFSGWTHSLTRYAYCLSVLVVMLVGKEALSVTRENNKMTSISKTIVYACLFIILLNGVKISNMIYTQRELCFNATLSQMTVVVSDLRDMEEFSAKETKVAFVGTSVDFYDIEPFDQYSELWALKPCIKGSHTAPYYFRYILDYPINVCDDAIQAEIQMTDEVQKMPCYPEKGYMRYVDDILVVKLSEPDSIQ